MKTQKLLAACVVLICSAATAQTNGRPMRGAIDAETATGDLVRGVPSDAMGRCNDGMFTKASKKTSACLSHGGLKIWYSDNTAGPQTSGSAARTSSDPNMAVGELVRGIPSDATAKCNDGSFSKVGKKANACLEHGGLAIWYPG